MPRERASRKMPVLEPGMVVEYFWATHQGRKYFRTDRSRWLLRTIVHEEKLRYGIDLLEFILEDDHLGVRCRICDPWAFHAFKHVLLTRIACCYNSAYGRNSSLFERGGPRILLEEPGKEAVVLRNGPSFLAALILRHRPDHLGTKAPRKKATRGGSREAVWVELR